MPAGMTAARLHTVIGTTVYFSMLFVIYKLAGSLCRRFLSGTGALRQNTSRQNLTPVFWYAVMVLGLPALGRWYRRDWAGFWQYAALVAGVCVMLLLPVWIFRKVVHLAKNFSSTLEKIS